jgi:hypothetical protein
MNLMLRLSIKTYIIREIKPKLLIHRQALLSLSKMRLKYWLMRAAVPVVAERREFGLHSGPVSAQTRNRWSFSVSAHFTGSARDALICSVFSDPSTHKMSYNV